jgi:methylated-DNA-[protein]-cysteine S-methyltransferase
MILTDTLDSPIGPLTVAGRGGRVCLLHFGRMDPAIQKWLEKWFPGEPHANGSLDAVRAVLAQYFGGDVAALDTVGVELKGTAFQVRVWKALRGIPAGTTISYQDLARRIGEPAAVRAVGAANGANPVAVIVPCHRVIGADGSLTGYGGGLQRKQWLLSHEGVASPLLF